MSITLESLTVAFDRLNPDQQLMLLDYLAERTPYADELFAGIWDAAEAHGRFIAEDEYPGAYDQDVIADDIASGIVAPSMSTREYRERHNERRAASLNRSFESGEYWAAVRRNAA